MGNLFKICITIPTCTQHGKQRRNICCAFKPLCHHITRCKGIQRIRRKIITEIKSTGNMIDADKCTDMIHVIGKALDTRCIGIDKLRVHSSHAAAPIPAHGSPCPEDALNRTE